MRYIKLLILTLLSSFCIDINAQNGISSDNIPTNDSIKYYHYDSLSYDKIEATYKLIDSLSQEEERYYNKINNIIGILVNGQIPIYVFNLNLRDIMDYNVGNGYMLGLGLETNERLSKVFSVSGFGNYWFKAKEFNYGGDVTFNILRSHNMKIKVGAYHKFDRLGSYGFEENATLLNPSNYKHFYTDATSLDNSAFVNYSTSLTRYLKAFINFEVADKTVFSDELSTNHIKTHRLSTIDFKLRIAFKKNHASNEKTSVWNEANPVIWLSYQRNLKGVFGSPYKFDKFEFLFRGKKDIRRLGETSLAVQFGYMNGHAPITELFNIYGTGKNKFDIYCTESFSTMHPDEFFCDRFGALYFSHNFKNFLLNFRKFHPEIKVIANIAWGKIGNDMELKLSDLSKGYYESGIIIDNIINTGIAKLGIGTFYRYGPYSHNETWDNFVFKISLGFCL